VDTPPPRPLPPEPLHGLWHELRPGESIAGLAHRYQIPREDIEELNGLGRGEAPPVGRVIFLPGARAVEPVAASRAARTSPPPGPSAPGSAPAGRAFLWPVPGGVLTSGFGARGGRPHEGIDIAAPEGSAVVAAADGVVIYSGSGVRGYGNLILIRHAGGIVTVYAHNRRNRVAEKERVRRGQVIAEVGRTGNATSNHLHFELRAGETPRDPVPLLDKDGR
jgi:murein DD-endopeptidase MepM/ murein hydrolase activator NlpD